MPTHNGLRNRHMKRQLLLEECRGGEAFLVRVSRSLQIRTCLKLEESVNHIEPCTTASVKGNDIWAGRPIINLNVKELIRHNTLCNG